MFPTESLLADSWRARNIPPQYCHTWLFFFFLICYPRQPLQDPWPDRILMGVGLTRSGHYLLHPLEPPFCSSHLLTCSTLVESHIREIFHTLMSHSVRPVPSAAAGYEEKGRSRRKGHNWKGHALSSVPPSTYRELAKVLSSPKWFQRQLHAWMSTAAWLHRKLCF